jgi:membrane protein DedA with SNARE-associated domain
VLALTAAAPGLIDAAVHLHHHVHGPKGDYVGLGLAAAAGWAGVPGPGEAALITAAVLAERHKLDIVSVIAVAWLGATLGGTAGWAVGIRAGRAVLTAPGPLQKARLSALDRGDRFFERFGPVAVFLTPSWVAGIVGMRAVRFLVLNALAALFWAVALGLGVFLAGPPIADLFADLGLIGGIALGVVALIAAVTALVRGRSRRRRR